VFSFLLSFSQTPFFVPPPVFSAANFAPHPSVTVPIRAPPSPPRLLFFLRFYLSSANICVVPEVECSPPCSLSQPLRASIGEEVFLCLPYPPTPHFSSFLHSFLLYSLRFWWFILSSPVFCWYGNVDWRPPSLLSPLFFTVPSQRFHPEDTFFHI